MSAAALARLFALYVVALAVACASVRGCVALRVDPAHPAEIVATVWREGQPIARAIVARERDADDDPALTAARATPGAALVYETVVAEGPVLARPELVFALSIVAGVDGVKARAKDGRVAYVTPDELLARQAYDKDLTIPELSLSIGTDVPLVLALLAERLDLPVPELRDTATFRRVRVVRTLAARPNTPRLAPAPPPTPATLRADEVRAAALDAARYLARGVRADGRFRYFVDAPTNRTLPGYDWPRHAGATYFMAQAAALSKEPELADAARRAASLVRDAALVTCGEARCVGEGDVVEIGSSALVLIALVEIVRTGIDTSFAPLVKELAAFLRTQQRRDGEFMHQYDRHEGHPIDVQFLYFSGEATLALARAASLTSNAADLDAASKGLAHLVGPAWSFFGDRYYFGEEHWTCQAMDDLWDRAPNETALDFCVRWNAFSRGMQFGPDDTPWDADGAFGVSPIVTPRLTPVGSRCEAAVATLDAARKAKLPKREQDALDLQLRRSLALLLRHQFRPGVAHLFADPHAVHGAMPGSPVDWQLRIDYAQHAGSAMIRWLEVTRAE